MMTGPLTHSEILDALRHLDTCTASNAIEINQTQQLKLDLRE